jgi:hypothetical protein
MLSGAVAPGSVGVTNLFFVEKCRLAGSAITSSEQVKNVTGFRSTYHQCVGDTMCWFLISALSPTTMF